MYSFNQTETDLEHDDIIQAFAQTLRDYPHNVLVSFQGHKYTYAQGAWIANKISDKLYGAKINPRDNVAILVHRSQWYLLASLGVLAFGAAYVPIDDGFPDNRIAFMLTDTNARAILVSNKTKQQAKRILASEVFDREIALIEVDEEQQDGSVPMADIDLKHDDRFTETYKSISTGDNHNTTSVNFIHSFRYYSSNPRDNAFIVYTSGTTGKPKAIQITRVGILNCAQWYVKFSQMQQDDVYALYSSFVFDMHMVGFYTTILCGASVDIVPEQVRFDTGSLNSYFVEVGATHTYLPTQIGRIFASRKFETSIKFLLVIGEKLGEFKAPDNFIMCESYGPTETLAFVTAIRLKDRKYPNSIGRPIANTKAYVLDKEGKMVTDGQVGELYISTKQISNGYINRHEENEQAFLHNPFDSEVEDYEVMYKTGDMVKILPDGTIGFIGRQDSQVKIRGNRVELAEVESCIRELDFIEDVTSSTIDNHGNLALVAYLVLDDRAHSYASQDTLKASKIKQKIANHIRLNKPSYMIPSYFVILESIPLNVNGKVDKKALPSPQKTEVNATVIKPTSITEANLLKYACEALEICENNVGVNSDLRLCGLDSVSALRVTYVWKDKCNIDCPAYEILKYGTIQSIMQNCKIDVYQAIQNPYKCSSNRTLYFVHPRNSSSISYSNLMNGFTNKFNFSCIENYNFYHLDSPVRGYKNLAKLYVGYLREQQPHGPYYLGGWSLGGCIAFEMAKILHDQGEEVKKLYLLDPVYAKNTLTQQQIGQVAQIVNNWYFESDWSKAITNPFSEKLLEGYSAEYKGQEIDELSYSPSHYSGSVTFFKASEKSPKVAEIDEFKNTDIEPENLPEAIRKASIEKPANGFEEYINDLKIIQVPTEHDNLMFAEPAKFIAQKIEEDIQN